MLTACSTWQADLFVHLSIWSWVCFISNDWMYDWSLYMFLLLTGMEMFIFLQFSYHEPGVTHVPLSQMMLLITPVLLLPVADVLSEYRALYKTISAELFSFWDLCRVMLRFLFSLFVFQDVWALGSWQLLEVLCSRAWAWWTIPLLGYEYLLGELDVRCNHSNHAEIKVSSDWANRFCQHWDWDWQLDETISNLLKGWITILLFTSCMWVNINVF